MLACRLKVTKTYEGRDFTVEDRDVATKESVACDCAEDLYVEVQVVAGT